MEAIVRRLPRGGIFVDGGANVGLVTFSVGSRRPDATIHAFEPQPACAEQWRENHRLNPAVNAHLVEAALGEEVGTVELSHEGDPSNRHVRLSFEPALPAVPMTSLDAYAEDMRLGVIDVVKLDLEGYEPLALRGAARLLREGRIRCLVCELVPGYPERYGFRRSEVTAELLERGFRIEAFPTLGMRRTQRAPDLLFVRD
ncbi:MAG TPA: FkbM family methyltransferase [Solirubrobacteraceae bacterium]|nr:FkbM family methyltransferase [Solirubrobacteraceae bacterium]